MKQKKESILPQSTPRHATAASIAAYIGLSRATVTHVLNGRAEEQRIRPETQRRVLEGARDLGYRPNNSARAIRTGRFGNIALIQSLRAQYLPSELLYGLTTAIADKEMHLVLTEVPDVVIEDETYLPHTMRELAVDGVLINRLAGFSQPFVELIHELRIPAVFLNVQQEFDCVHPDDLQGGRIAAEYLLRMGHERIAFVGAQVNDKEHYSERDRRTGYETAMKAAGKSALVYPLPPDWASYEQMLIDRRVETAHGLLSHAYRPTAVIAYELAEAMAVVHAAHQMGMRIPRDLSLILFHNKIDHRFCMPLHTVSNVMEKIGVEAVNMLMAKIETPDVPLAARAVPMEMLEGGSCLPPKTSR